MPRNSCTALLIIKNINFAIYGDADYQKHLVFLRITNETCTETGVTSAINTETKSVLIKDRMQLSFYLRLVVNPAGNFWPHPGNKGHSHDQYTYCMQTSTDMRCLLRHAAVAATAAVAVALRRSSAVAGKLHGSTNALTFVRFRGRRNAGAPVGKE